MKNDLYKDNKGNRYQIIGISKHFEILEEFVVYKDLNTDDLFICPLSKWEIQMSIQDCMTEDNSSYDGINNNSSPNDKIELFMSLFSGREDVYPIRWENKTKGNSGYKPLCLNEWGYSCPKNSLSKFKCSECKEKQYEKFDYKAVEKHLKGIHTIGVYPMLLDETCRFLVFDFDEEDYINDITYVVDVCDKLEISHGIERSRSGNGVHLWIFFKESIKASVARKFGSCLLTYTMNINHELNFKSYDRMLPNQDIMPSGGFGNLIILPLQKIPRESGNSVFVNKEFIVYKDQWNFLYNIKRYSLEEIESFIKFLSNGNELGLLYIDTENDEDKPWETNKNSIKFDALDIPKDLEIVRSNMLYIEKSNLSNKVLNYLKRLATFKNPEFYKSQAMRLSTYNIFI